MIDFEIGFVIGVCMTVAIYCGYRAWVSWQTEAELIDSGDPISTFPPVAEQGPTTQTFISNDPVVVAELAKYRAHYLKKKQEEKQFAVSGKPARVPWHIRKRELAEAAKTKRKKLESFQEID